MLFIDIIGVTLLVAFTGWMLYLPANAIRTGIAHRAGASHKRRKQPVQFWITVAVQALFACAFFLVLVYRLIKHS